MIEARELRIGNYVNALGQTIAIGDGNKVNSPKSWNTVILTFDLIDAIPLTEEWLVKLGFEYDEFADVRFWYKEDVSLGANDDYPYYENSMKIVYVKHVHQLQNLYFALTGEELTIK